MKRTGRMSLCLLLCLVLGAGCATSPPVLEPTVKELLARAQANSVLGPDSQFSGSPYIDVDLKGLFPGRRSEIRTDPTGTDHCLLIACRGSGGKF